MKKLMRILGYMPIKERNMDVEELRRRISTLKGDIRTLVLCPSSMGAARIAANVQMLHTLEMKVWGGA